MPTDVYPTCKIRRICNNINTENPYRVAAEQLLADKCGRLNPLLNITYPFDVRCECSEDMFLLVIWIIEHSTLDEAQHNAVLVALHHFVSNRIAMLGPISIRSLSCGTVGLITAAVLAVLLVAMAIAADGKGMDLAVIGLFICGIVTVLKGITSIVPYSDRVRERRCVRLLPAIRLLGTVGTAESAGIVAMALRYPAAHDTALVALRNIVERLVPEDLGTVSSRSLLNICDALSRVDDTAAIVLLRALDSIGDGSCIRAVLGAEVLYSGTEIASAAARLLPVLHERSEQRIQSTTLLRANTLRGTAKAELLRIVSQNHKDDVDVLLRTSTGNKNQEIKTKTTMGE